MKRLTYFSRTCTVPGGSKVNPEGGPLHVVLLSRVAYRVYADDRAVVYSGIDRGMPTKVAVKQIIELIAAREQIDPAGWSFFDLITSMHTDELDPGEFELHLISWRVDGGTMIVEGSIEVDCPDLVLDDFDTYINRAYYTDGNLMPSDVESDDDDEDDSDEDDDDEPSRPIPPAPGSTN